MVHMIVWKGWFDRRWGGKSMRGVSSYLDLIPTSHISCQQIELQLQPPISTWLSNLAREQTSVHGLAGCHHANAAEQQQAALPKSGKQAACSCWVWNFIWSRSFSLSLPASCSCSCRLSSLFQFQMMRFPFCGCVCVSDNQALGPCQREHILHNFVINFRNRGGQESRSRLHTQGLLPSWKSVVVEHQLNQRTH